MSEMANKLGRPRLGRLARSRGTGSAGLRRLATLLVIASIVFVASGAANVVHLVTLPHVWCELHHTLEHRHVTDPLTAGSVPGLLPMGPSAADAPSVGSAHTHEECDWRAYCGQAVEGRPPGLEVDRPFNSRVSSPPAQQAFCSRAVYSYAPSRSPPATA